MSAVQTKDEFMDEEWEFGSYEEMMYAAKEEAVICGDDINESGDESFVEIWNYHQQGVRWKGSVV